MKGRILTLALAAMACAGCGSDGERPVPVPRQRAYPRMQLYPEAYSPVQVGDLTLMVNDSARTTVKGLWADICYPAYGMTVNCTVTPVNVATVESVLSNREERMALNAGSAQGELASMQTTSGSSATLLETYGHGGLTPLQFIATDSASYVLSGAVTCTTNAYDSVRPALNAVRADLITLLKSI